MQGGRATRLEPRRPNLVLRLLGKLFLLLFVGAIALGIAGAIYVQTVPLPPDEVPLQTTFLYDRNGTEIAQLSGGENRQVVRLGEIPKVLVDAVLAAEDRRFYEHGGLDPIGIARALVQDLRHSGANQGGSTITQQYVKNVYVGREASIRRKLREAAIAVKLERSLSKDQILEGYLNAVYFGRGAYGVQAASKVHFGKNVSELSLPQAAYLAALLRGPESTDAMKDEGKARRRRSSVLEAMVEMGTISRAEQIEADATPLIGKLGVIPRRTSSSAIRHPEVVPQYFVGYVRDQLVERYGEAAVRKRGLRVTTTFDLDMQTSAYEATFKKTLNKENDPQAAVVLLDKAGGVRAMVGGRDWSASKVNLAVGVGGGGLGRPAGSTFKTFALAAVVEKGFTLESAFPSPASLSIDGADANGDSWKVRNFDGKSSGNVNLITATQKSLNTVFAQVVTNENIGPKALADIAKKMGVTSTLPDVNSLVLGTANVGALEMADAYLTLANRGVWTEPSVLLHVEDADGKALDLRKPQTERVLTEEQADMVTAVLRKVVDSGTGKAAAVSGLQVAGKTGTTNDYNDAWFVGYTPKECCAIAVWMGYADGTQRMTDVHGVRVSGGTFPAEVARRVLSVAVDPDSDGSFEKVTKFPGDLLGSRRIRNGQSTSSTKKRSPKPPTETTVVSVAEPPVQVVTETVPPTAAEPVSPAAPEEPQVVDPPPATDPAQ